MKPSRILLVVTAAVLVAFAFPAAAFENEFHGYFQTNFINSNFNRSEATNDPGDGFYHPEGKDADASTATLFEQRVRLAYTGKASDDLKLVTKFEMDYAYWGNSSYGVARNSGGALGSDEINFETKHLYLDFNIPGTPVNAKVGMQPFGDSFQGIIISADAAGIVLGTPYGQLGLLRFFDDGDIPGDSTADMVSFDTSYKLSETLKIGGAYYLLLDDRADLDLTLHMLGVNAEAVVGPATLSGFFLYQTGDAGDGIDVSAWAAQANAKVKAGPGTLRADFLYVPGDDDLADDDVEVLQVVPGENGYYGNKLVILGRDEWAMTTDNSIVYDVNNLGQGVMMAAVGYDLPLGAKATCGVNAGMAWVGEKNGDQEGDFLGTEINADINYTILDGLTATLRGAYVMLGDYYDGVAAGGEDPDDPWDLKAILSYGF